MPRQLHWGELTGGIIAVAVIAVLIIVILLFARVGQLHGKKVTLYVVTDEAAGVLPGTEVWLAGQKRGMVKEVSFRPPSTDTLERLLIRTEFLAEAMPSVRRDSYASIRPGGSLIGMLILYISAGSATSPPLKDGDTVHTRHLRRMANLTADVGSIMPAVSGLASELGKLNRKLSTPTGTLGIAATQGMPRMPEVTGRMSRIAAQASQGGGTLGLGTRTNLMERASHAMAATDSIRTLMSSNTGSVGRFRRDTTLVTKARGVLAQLDTLSTLAAGPVGAIAAAHSDSALTRALARNRVLLDSLIQDIRSHPGRYFNFF
jgi:hypothetical protein